MSTYLLDQLKNLEGRAERKFFCPDNHLVRQFSFFFFQCIHNITYHQYHYQDSIYSKWMVMLLLLSHIYLKGKVCFFALFINPFNVWHNALHMNTVCLKDSDDRCLWNLHIKSWVYEITLKVIFFLKIQLSFFFILIVAGQEWKGKKWQLIKSFDKAKPGKMIFKT